MSNNRAKPVQVPELTTEQVYNVLTEPLRLASTFLSSGVKIIDTTGPLRLPIAPNMWDDAGNQTVGTSTGDAWWHAESEQITEANAIFKELKLMPSTMESVKVITRYSNELARAAVFGLDAVLSTAMVTEVAQKLDRQMYSAGGDGIRRPRGMFAWQGTTSIDVTQISGGPLNLDAVLAAQGRALAAGSPLGNLKLYLSPADFVDLRSQKNQLEQYVLTTDATEGPAPTVLGMPLVVAPFIPKGFAAVADPSQIVVARDASPSVKILTERYADFDQQAVRVVCRYDVGVLNPRAVVVLKNITTSSGRDADAELLGDADPAAPKRGSK